MSPDRLRASEPEPVAAPIGWAILELMGHRRLAGYLTEQEVAGAKFLRLDVHTDCPDCGSSGEARRDGVRVEPPEVCDPCKGRGARPVATQLYSPAAVYAITPTTWEIAMDVAERNKPEPVQRWELPRLAAATQPGRDAATTDAAAQVPPDPKPEWICDRHTCEHQYSEHAERGCDECSCPQFISPIPF